MKKLVLVIDHDEEVYEHIREALENDVVSVSHVYTPEEGLFRMKINNYSLIVMDVALSEQSGKQVIAAMRGLQPMPILVLSESASTQERVAALKEGADDFLAKPYELEECLARAQALLRRYTELNHIAERGYAFVGHEKLMLDTARRMVIVDGQEIALSKKEYGILHYLLKHRNQVLTYEQIYEAVWEDMYLQDNAAIFYQIGNIRRKLGDPELIKTVIGIGYWISDSKNE